MPARWLALLALALALTLAAAEAPAGTLLALRHEATPPGDPLGYEVMLLTVDSSDGDLGVVSRETRPEYRAATSSNATVTPEAAWHVEDWEIRGQRLVTTDLTTGAQARRSITGLRSGAPLIALRIDPVTLRLWGVTQADGPGDVLLRYELVEIDPASAAARRTGSTFTGFMLPGAVTVDATGEVRAVAVLEVDGSLRACLVTLGRDAPSVTAAPLVEASNPASAVWIFPEHLVHDCATGRLLVVLTSDGHLDLRSIDRANGEVTLLWDVPAAVGDVLALNTSRRLLVTTTDDPAPAWIGFDLETGGVRDFSERGFEPRTLVCVPALVECMGPILAPRPGDRGPRLGPRQR